MHEAEAFRHWSAAKCISSTADRHGSLGRTFCSARAAFVQCIHALLDVFAAARQIAADRPRTLLGEPRRHPQIALHFFVLRTELTLMKALQVATLPRGVNSYWLTKILAVCCLPILGFSGCQDTGTSTLPPEAVVERSSTGALAPGDVIRISFSGAPELNQAQAVDAHGKVSLPLIGQVTAGGKKLGAFQSELSELYKTQLQNTQVIVTQEKSAIPVILSGAVARPGKLVLDEQSTVLEAILQAGGATNVGNLKKVRIIRIVDGKHYTQIVNLDPAMRGRPSQVYYVKYGDIIFVPERLF